MSPIRRRLSLILTVLAIALYGSCQELDVTAVDVAQVQVTPSTVTLPVGDVRQLQAVARDAAGNELRGRATTWSVGDPDLASVDGSGRVTGLGAGTTTVSASIEGMAGQATVTVVVPPVASVEVTPASSTLDVGETVQLQVTLRDEDGNTISGPAVTFSSTSSSIASVNASGLVTAVAAGTTTIRATAQGQTGEASITVRAGGVETVTVTPGSATLSIGASVDLTAVLRAADGSVVTGPTPTWSSSNSGVATVNASGRVTGVASGTATITATAAGKSGQATVTVSAQPVASVELEPSSATLFVNGTLQLQVTVRAANGNVLTDRPVTFTSLDPTVLTVNSVGTVDALLPGTARIVAAAEAVADTATITVIQQPVDQVQVQPGSATIIVGGTVQLQAVLRAADGTVLTDRQITWTSDAASVADVNATGLVTGRAQGTAKITATAEGKSATADITVSPQPVDKVTVAPATASVEVGSDVQLQATLTAADGTVLTGRVVNWTTSASAVATVDNTGKVTGVGAGTATITATAEGKSGTSAVTVTISVASVTVSPDPTPALFPGQSTQVTAAVLTSGGTPITTRPVSWTAGSGLQVSASGSHNQNATVTVAALPSPCSGARCSATITATADGVQGQGRVPVIKPAASLDLGADPQPVVPGATIQLTAQLRAADGTNLTGSADHPIQWTSSESGIASVDASGKVTATGATCPTGQRSCTAVITATVRNNPQSGGDDRSDNLTVTVNKPVNRITISPASPGDLYPGGQVQLTASATASDGTAITDQNITWSGWNANVVDVAVSGSFNERAAVTAESPPSCSGAVCSTTLRAAIGSVNAQVTVRVRKVASSVTVTPDPPAPLAIGGTVQLTAKLTAGDNTDLTGALPVTWSSADPAIATVSSSGVVTGVAAPCPQGQQSCQTTITASVANNPGTGSDDISDGVTVSVLKKVNVVTVSPQSASLTQGDTQPYQAILTASDGTTLTGRAVSWASSALAAATVCPASGAPTTATAVGPGSASITATSEGVRGSGSLDVTAGIVSVDITPNPVPPLLPGQQVQLTATGKDAGGSPVQGPVTWTNIDGAVLQLVPSGPFQEVATITVVGVPSGCQSPQQSCATNVTAQIGGASGNASLTILKPVAQVAISPDPPQPLLPGQQVQLSAALTASDGSPLSGRTISWNSLDGTVASVDQNGLVSAVGAPCATGNESCTVTIEATAEGVTDQVTVTVLKPVATVTVTPSSATLSLTGLSGPRQQQFTAQLEAADGTALTNRTITWSVGGSSPGAVTLSTTTGTSTTATAAFIGNATVNATSEGQSASASVTVGVP